MPADDRRVRVKVCGITSVGDALAAVEAGADALGFVFAESPRRIAPEEAALIIRELPPLVATVGLVVDRDPAAILAVCPLDAIQFHGSETPEQVAAWGRRAIRAFRVRSEADLPLLSQFTSAGAFLLDAFVPGVPGGTGRSFPWRLAVEAKRFGRPIIVAGGLTPENVAECVAMTRPYAVDVSSGVEASPGRKDPAKLRDFIAAVRRAA